jgi:hypothetical protein
MYMHMYDSKNIQTESLRMIVQPGLSSRAGDRSALAVLSLSPLDTPHYCTLYG